MSETGYRPRKVRLVLGDNPAQARPLTLIAGVIGEHPDRPCAWARSGLSAGSVTLAS
jgi:hypothetical protein